MAFTVYIEHEVIDGTTVVEEFENVIEINNPPVSTACHLKFADEQDNKRLRHGELARIEDND